MHVNKDAQQCVDNVSSLCTKQSARKQYIDLLDSTKQQTHNTYVTSPLFVISFLS